jgi:DNA polymerase III alpha subunit
MGIDILPRSINKCKIDYQISAEKDLSSGVYRSSICPSIMCKGLSSAAAESIVKHQKYKDLRDFAAKTEAKSVDKKAIEALYQAGFFDRDKNKKNIVDDFCVIREDLKKALKKGVEDVDIFNM